jgi:hypothetical protein
MASEAVINAVNSRVAANWTYTTIVYPNTLGAVPDDGSPYLEVLFPVTTEDQLSIGGSSIVYEELGGFRFCLYLPVGVTINPPNAPWMTRIEALMAAFRGVSFQGVECLGFVGPTFRDDSDEGEYYEISFTVSYRFLKVV